MSDAPVDPVTPEPETAPVGKTLTDEQLQRMMSKEKTQGRQAVLSELGFDSPEAAKAFIEEVNKRKDAEKTELQRAIDAAAAKDAEVESARKEALTVSHKSLVKDLLEEAGVPKAVRERAVGLLNVAPGATAEEINGDIEALKTDFPALFTTATETRPTTAPSHVQGRPPSVKPVGEDPMTLGSERAAAYVQKPGYNPLA